MRHNAVFARRAVDAEADTVVNDTAAPMPSLRIMRTSGGGCSRPGHILVSLLLPRSFAKKGEKKRSTEQQVHQQHLVSRFSGLRRAKQGPQYLIGASVVLDCTKRAWSSDLILRRAHSELPQAQRDGWEPVHHAMVPQVFLTCVVCIMHGGTARGTPHQSRLSLHWVPGPLSELTDCPSGPISRCHCG